LIIGGGNYFELWVESSATGTSIDITPERLAALTVPTVFFALGVDTGQGYSVQTKQRFSSFINTVLSRNDMFVCVRNDGSQLALNEVLGEETASRIPTIPDGGFFADPAGCKQAYADSGRIGINIAGDMLERRFDKGLTSRGFLQELGLACCELLEAKPGLRIDFMPHIWRDNVIVGELLPFIADNHLRRSITVGRLDPSYAGLPGFLESYRNFDLVLGMRFHANVCPLGMGVPSRGLLNYPQVARLYEEIGMSDRVIDVREPGFGRIMIDTVITDLIDLSTQRRLCAERIVNLKNQADATLQTLKSWLNKMFL